MVITVNGIVVSTSTTCCHEASFCIQALKLLAIDICDFRCIYDLLPNAL